MIHCYKFNGYNIVLDIASGSIHSVDDVAYDVIRLFQSVDESEGWDGLISQVKDMYPDVTRSDVADIITDIETLRSRGKLFSPDVFVDVAGTLRTECEVSLKALCLNVSHACNMSCAYCFAGHGGYGGDNQCVEDKVCGGDGGSLHGKDRLRSADNPRGGELMGLDTAKRAIDFLVLNSGDKKNLDVDFFGGEPLLNWEVIKDTVKYARDVQRRSGKMFRFTLTTNALLIDDDVIDFTNKEMHNVVLSLDGRPETHDAMRKLPGGDGSYVVVAEKIKKLVDARRGKGYYIRGTFTRGSKDIVNAGGRPGTVTPTKDNLTHENIDFVNDILHLADLGFKELSMEPVVTKHGETYGFSLDDLPELCRQYDMLAVEMLRREKLDRGFSFYHFNLDLTGGPCVYKRIAGCGVATEYLAVTPRGELYPCHQFIGDTDFLMGDVWRGVVNSKLRDEFAGCNIYSNAVCKTCWARFYCSGGCKANAYHDMGSISGIYKLGCELFKKRIECAIMLQVAKSTKR